jgi:hypothetical protein
VRSSKNCFLIHSCLGLSVLVPFTYPTGLYWALPPFWVLSALSSPCLYKLGKTAPKPQLDNFSRQAKYGQ